MSKEKYISNAKEVLKEHEYTLLAKGDDCEIWKCSKSNTNVYAFNIAVTPMGISVVGDIGDYTFGVYGRNVSFLAGRDVEYYIHSKLSPNCKEVEFDMDNFREAVVNEIKDHTEVDYEEIYEKIKDLYFDEIKDCLWQFWKNSLVTDEIYDFLNNITDVLKEADLIEDANGAYTFLENCKTLNFADSWEYELEKPSEKLIRTLYIINEAAKQIVEKVESEN